MATMRRIADYARFLTPASLARQPSPIRALQPLMAQPGMISLAGGLPNPSQFPITNIALTLRDGTKLDLGADATRAALQYGPTTGHPQLVEFMARVQARVHHADPAATGLCMGNGSQDLLAKAVAALVGDGDTLLIENPTYVGTLAFLRPQLQCGGVQLCPVPTDARGLVPSALARALDAWPTAKRKPRVLYTIPTGGNPTGAVQDLERKQQIYQIARQHDLIILEDDPYYYLQFVASPPALSGPTSPLSTKDLAAAEDYASQLVPSYLSMDTDGRVLRFESLSKVLSAGLRLGLVTGPKPLVDRIALDIQATALQPAGPSMAFALALAKGPWHNDPRGFLAHAARTAQFYAGRRDAFMRAVQPLVDARMVELGSGRPGAGMFVWMRLLRGLDARGDATALITQHAAAKNVLLLPGGVFVPPPLDTQPCPWVRATFATATDDQLRLAFERLRECIEEAERQQRV